MPLTPRPAGLVGGSATGLLALSGALATQAQLATAAKEDRAGVEAEGPRGERTVRGGAGGRGWQAALLRALSSAQYEGVNEGNPRAPLLPAGRVSLGEFLTLPGRVSNGYKEGMIHPLQGCWEEKGDSELGRGIYKLWRAVPHPWPWETTPSLTLFSFSLPPSPPTRQWSEPRAG